MVFPHPFEKYAHKFPGWKSPPKKELPPRDPANSPVEGLPLFTRFQKHPKWLGMGFPVAINSNGKIPQMVTKCKHISNLIPPKWVTIYWSLVDFSGRWFQPLWKILYSQIGHLPQVGMKIKNIWNHHLDFLVSGRLSRFTTSPPSDPTDPPVFRGSPNEKCTAAPRDVGSAGPKCHVPLTGDGSRGRFQQMWVLWTLQKILQISIYIYIFKTL